MFSQGNNQLRFTLQKGHSVMSPVYWGKWESGLETEFGDELGGQCSQELRY